MRSRARGFWYFAHDICSSHASRCAPLNLPCYTSSPRSCRQCGANTYQPESTTTVTRCTEQTKCPAGFKISADSSVEARTCDDECDKDFEFIDVENHRRMTCSKQPTCRNGQYLSEATGSDKERVCIDCDPEYQYQDARGHQESACKEQPECSQSNQYLVRKNTHSIGQRFHCERAHALSASCGQ